MKQREKEKIIKIKDEVKELHPLIEKLLQKIPEIHNYEYTHGQSEMGADFVFLKKDNLLGDNVYVGIIAKIGKISTDFSEIERQIGECAVQRFYAGGKEKIKLSEIWVINTDNITYGAQRKINEKFASTNIRFIDGSKLSVLISKYLPTFWLDLNIEVGEYLMGLRERTIELDKAFSLVPYVEKDIYIHHDIVEFKGYATSKIKEKVKSVAVDICESIVKHKVIFVEGDMGSGKSKLLRYYINHFTDVDVYSDSNIVPVFCGFKDFVDDYKCSVSDMIKDKLGAELSRVLIAEQKVTILLLIDSVDEKDISAADKRKILSDLFYDIKQVEKTRAIITSRHLEEVEDLFKSGSLAYRCRILPLTMDKTMLFLREICLRMKIDSRLIEDIKSSHLLKEMPRTPISAILLAKLLHENSQDLPSNLTELYSKYVELVLGRWDIDKGLILQTQKEYQALDNILMDLACYMIDNELQSVSIDEVEQRFRSYLSSRNLEINYEELFKKMYMRCEIIVVNYENNNISFKHRAFAEFLMAKKHSQGRSLVIDKKAFDVYWENVYFFYVGILKDCPEILGELINFKPENELQSLVKVKNMASYYLAAYTTPYYVVSDGFAKILLESSSLYIDIVEAKKDTVFLELPRLPLLLIWLYIVKECYSYKFFQEAIEDVSLKIDESKVSDQEKMYALFFLSVINMGITGVAESSFDFLIQKYAKYFPQDLAVSLYRETNKEKGKSILLKKFERNMFKQLGNNILYKQSVKKMFSEPLKNHKLKSLVKKNSK